MQHRMARALGATLATLLMFVPVAQSAAARDAARSRHEAKAALQPLLYKAILPSPGERNLPLRTANEPFESTSFRVAGPLAQTWQAVKFGMLADAATLALCRLRDETCSPAAKLLSGIVAEGLSRDGIDRIGVINRAINLAIKPTNDPYVWHSPLETLSVGEGDCKDYAITKYVALLEAGFREQDVKLVIVHDVRADQDHAIVAVRFSGDWIVLDNRWLALVRDFELRRAVALYILDENGVRRFGHLEAKYDRAN
jgi:predicted transglutaminase-like cysteine proteinase